MHFTDKEGAFLARIQADIPITERPYGVLADELGINENDAVAMASDLRDRGIIRNISAIFNTASLGYRTALAAVEVDPSMVETAAEIINGYPGVSHNYLREHRYNLWFTVAVRGDDTVERIAGRLAEKCKARDLLIFRNEKLYKLGVRLRVNDDAADSSAAEVTAAAYITGESIPGPGDLSGIEREAVVLLQKDLPACVEPFKQIISDAGSPLSIDQLIETGRSLKNRGVMRRYSAVLKHRRAGFSANPMTVWRASDEEIEKAARIFRDEPAVSHLYRRTLHPGKWDYPLFAMLHAKSVDSAEEIIGRLSRLSGIKDYLALYSTREFKKKRVTYFSRDIDDWKLKEGL
jgi:DNA-binding Lrp family transcriptional regulator